MQFFSQKFTYDNHVCSCLLPPLQFSLTLIVLFDHSLFGLFSEDRYWPYSYFRFLSTLTLTPFIKTHKKRAPPIFPYLSWPNKFGHQLHVWCPVKWLIINRLKENKNHQKVILTGLPRGDFVWGEGVAVHTLCTLLGDFRSKNNGAV